jgi:hypothetical protein
MAQSALTVTTPNPTPPTNMAFTGTTGPNPPNFRRNTYDNPFNLDANKQPQSPYGVNPNPPPYFDDAAGGVALSGPGTGAVLPAFKTNAAALTNGASANDTAGPALSTAATGAGGTGVHATVGTYPGTGTLLTDVDDVGPVPASTSVNHEGAGTEIVVQKIYGATANDYNPNTFLPYSGTGGGIAGAVAGTWQLVTCSCGPTLPAPSVGAGPVSPNQTHASSLSPTTNPTLSSITPTTAVSGTGTTALTAVTGVGFTPQSVVYANGVAIPTVYVSSTTLTATMPKKATAGTWPITVVTGGVVTTLPQTFTWT